MRVVPPNLSDPIAILRVDLRVAGVASLRGGAGDSETLSGITSGIIYPMHLGSPS